MEEIEKFLLEQLKSDIDGARAELKQNKKQSFIIGECSRLIELIKNKEANTGAADGATRKGSIYGLSNVVSDWRAVRKNHNQCAPKAQIAFNKLSETLKTIGKKLEACTEVDTQKCETSQEEHKDKTKTTTKEFEVHEDVAIQKGETSQDKRKSGERPGLPNPYHVDISNIWGIKDKSQAMERLLVRKETNNKGFRAIGVVGMAGVGKTTFCQVAFNNDEVKKHFFPRIWVEMSKQHKGDEFCYRKEMVKSFLRCLGFDDNVIKEIEAKESPSLLLLALRKQLLGKRYLVVLDDIWHLDERFKRFCASLIKGPISEKAESEQKLEFELPKGSGGTLIFTSRSENWAVSVVGEKNLQRLTPLEDKESIWNIYMKTLIDNKHELNLGIEETCTEIVKTCAGLPLTAKVLAEILARGDGKEKVPKSK